MCAACWSSLPAPETAVCSVCGDPLPFEEDLRCGRCVLDPPAFDRLCAAAPYRGAAREILLAFKFRGADFLASRLAALMTERLTASYTPDEVVAVPSSRPARAFVDHAAHALAREVARLLATPFSPRRLRAVRSTERQSELPFSRRTANVRGAFRPRPPVPRRILLVDDVVTSGATARECARALRRGGAESVEVWCFARASRDDPARNPGMIRN